LQVETDKHAVWHTKHYLRAFRRY